MVMVGRSSVVDDEVQIHKENDGLTPSDIREGAKKITNKLRLVM
jgi:hypothetical protein